MRKKLVLLALVCIALTAQPPQRGNIDTTQLKNRHGIGVSVQTFTGSSNTGDSAVYDANGTLVSQPSTKLTYYASQRGCHINSNISSGGGTSDTVCVQNGVNALSTAGGGVWVEDGVSLIDGVNADGTTQWSALILPSNVSIACPSQAQGFFLAAHTDMPMLSNKNITGNPAVPTPDTNLGTHGCTWNGNGVNQDMAEQNNSNNNWVMAIWFGGVTKLRIENTVIKNSRTYCIIVENTSDWVWRDSACTWDAGGGQSSIPTSHVYHHDGIHMWSPVSNGYIHNFTSHWGDDDGLAFNTNEQVWCSSSTSMWGYQRCPWSGTGAAGQISNILVDGVNFDDNANGVRWIAVDSAGAGTGSLNNIVLKNIYGNITTQAMGNGATNCTGCGSAVPPTAGPMSIDGWYVTGLNTINMPASTSLAMSNIAAGVVINAPGATAAQQYPTLGGVSSLNSLAGPISLVGDSTLSVTPIGSTIALHATAGSGSGNQLFSQILTNDSPVALYEFHDQWASGSYNDSGPNGYNMTAINGNMQPILDSGMRGGMSGGGMYEPGGSTQASIPSGLQSAWPSGNNLTIEGMVKFIGTAGAGYGEIFDIGTGVNSQNNRVTFALQSSGNLQPYGSVYDSSGSACNVGTGFTLAPGEWHHLAFTYNGSICIFYLDGVQIGSTTTAVTVSSATRNVGGLFTSTHNDSANSVNISFLAFYNSALTSTRIAQHYGYILGN